MMNCSGCCKQMEDVGNRQPRRGTEFLGGGDYGSTITDQSYLRYAVYICDTCLIDLIKNGFVKVIDIRDKGARVSDSSQQENKMGITKETLEFQMLENDADAATFKEYFIALAREVCMQEENFSGKRPFGNSGWKNELYESMIYNNLVDAEKYNVVEGLTNIQIATLDSMINEMVNLL